MVRHMQKELGVKLVINKKVIQVLVVEGSGKNMKKYEKSGKYPSIKISTSRYRLMQ